MLSGMHLTVAKHNRGYRRMVRCGDDCISMFGVTADVKVNEIVEMG